MNILILDGNNEATNNRTITVGGITTAEGYIAVLKRIDPQLDCSIARPAYDCYNATDYRPQDVDGLVITGSAMHVYDKSPQVQNQIQLAADMLDAGVPTFGSCWGIQVGVVALGGRVQLNPRGSEFGVARGIQATTAGKNHPLLANKPALFDAVAIHSDEVSELPQGSTVLASNAMSDVQAVEVIQGNKLFWGVQYHPEFDLGIVARILERDASIFINAGFFRSQQDLDNVAKDYRTLTAYPDRLDLSWRYGVNDSVLNFSVRTCELANWLRFLVSRKIRSSTQA